MIGFRLDVMGFSLFASSTAGLEKQFSHRLYMLAQIVDGLIRLGERFLVIFLMRSTWVVVTKSGSILIWIINIKAFNITNESLNARVESRVAARTLAVRENYEEKKSNIDASLLFLNNCGSWHVASSTVNMKRKLYFARVLPYEVCEAQRHFSSINILLWNELVLKNNGIDTSLIWCEFGMDLITVEKLPSDVYSGLVSRYTGWSWFRKHLFPKWVAETAERGMRWELCCLAEQFDYLSEGRAMVGRTRAAGYACGIAMVGRMAKLKGPILTRTL